MSFRDLPRRESVQYGAILFAGLLLTVLAAWAFLLFNYSEDKKVFGRHADGYHNAMQRELSVMLSVLRSLAAGYDARRPLKISASRPLVDQLVANNAQIKRVEYFSILRGGKLSEMQNRLRLNGYPGLVLQPNPDPAGTTVTRVATLPREPNAMRLIGRDISRNKSLLKALAAGIAGGGPVAAAPVEDGSGLAYLLFQAAYRGDLIPATSDERRLAANGALALRVDLDRLLDNVGVLLSEAERIALEDDEGRRWARHQGRWRRVENTSDESGGGLFAPHRRDLHLHDLGLPLNIELVRHYVPTRGDVFVLAVIALLGLLFCVVLLGSLKRNILHRRERERYEKELLQHRDMLEQRVRDRTRELEAFSYSVSHDLRSPLRAINGFSQMLMSQCGDGAMRRERDFLARIIAATQRMDALIDDMLDLFRISYREVHVRQVNATSMATEAIRRIRDARDFSKARVTIQEGLVCNADPALFKVILHNLLENALNYSSRVTTPRVELGCKCMDGIDVLFVHDNGVGFDMRYAETVFEPFQRLHATDYTGTGIGLAIVKKAVEAQNGRVWIESEPGRGTTVYFSLFESPMLAREHERRISGGG